MVLEINKCRLTWPCMVVVMHFPYSYKSMRRISGVIKAPKMSWHLAFEIMLVRAYMRTLGMCEKCLFFFLVIFTRMRKSTSLKCQCHDISGALNMPETCLLYNVLSFSQKSTWPCSSLTLMSYSFALGPNLARIIAAKRATIVKIQQSPSSYRPTTRCHCDWKWIIYHETKLGRNSKILFCKSNSKQVG